MSYGRARLWIIRASLVSVGTLLVFLLIAPVANYPLEYEHVFRLSQIVVPVFLSYVGSAVHFVTRQSPAEPEVKTPPAHQRELFSLLVKGPIFLFAIITSAALFAFGFSNRTNAPSGSGMRLEHLSMAVTVALGFLTVSTSALVAYLFHAETPASEEATRVGARKDGQAAQ